MAPVSWPHAPSLCKKAVFALLTVNAIYYVGAGTLSERLDTLAWMTLLTLFVLEAAYSDHLAGYARVVHTIRLFAAIIVGAAILGYYRDGSWLDVINTALWMGVIILLELEMRYRELVRRHRVVFRVVAGLLYGSLAALLPIWAWQGAWLDAYDALLWLAAFAFIEMDLLAGFGETTRGVEPVA